MPPSTSSKRAPSVSSTRRVPAASSSTPSRLLQQLGYGSDAFSYLNGVVPSAPTSFAIEHKKVRVEPPSPGALETWRITTGGSSSWLLDLRLVLTKPSDLDELACIAARFAPPGSTVVMQADSHGAGTAFVGMVMTYNAERIPIGFVSGDIGCGMSVVPVVRCGALEHVRRCANPQAAHHAESYWLAKMRQSLKRGVGAEGGALASTSVLIAEAARFFGTDLGAWLDEMRYVLDTVGLAVTTPAVSSADPLAATEEAAAAAPLAGLTHKQTATLRFVSGYAQSLGSSGNHFMELATDASDAYWLVVHSGCRGLGAQVYSAIVAASRVLNAEALPALSSVGGAAECCAGAHRAAPRGASSKKAKAPATRYIGQEVVTGPLAAFYVRAHEALTDFAKLNRLLCALAVLRSVGASTSAPELQAVMCTAPLFAPAVAAFGSTAAGGEGAEAVASLLRGLVHNAIRAFVNDATREVHFVMCKGSVVMTRRAAVSIIALRAGEGCFLWTLADPTCAWRASSVAAAVQARDAGYAVVAGATDILSSGHGAGRARSTSATSKASSFEDVAAFFAEEGVVGNLAPGVLGDNPRSAYKDSAAVVATLPLDTARTSGFLKTRVSYKEGISYTQRENEGCAEWIKAAWPTATPDERLAMDINLCANALPAFDDWRTWRDSYIKTLDAEFAGCYLAHRVGHDSPQRQLPRPKVSHSIP